VRDRLRFFIVFCIEFYVKNPLGFVVESEGILSKGRGRYAMNVFYAPFTIGYSPQNYSHKLGLFAISGGCSAKNFFE
jgi:hypothetical protein